MVSRGGVERGCMCGGRERGWVDVGLWGDWQVGAMVEGVQHSDGLSSSPYKNIKNKIQLAITRTRQV